MRTKQLFGIIVTAAVVSSASLTATAQQQTSQTPTPQKQEAKSTPAKSAKVWSDDDLTSLRSPADIYKKEAQAAQAAAATEPAAPAKPGQSPAWSKVWTIKTPDDAQKAIDWDNRDIAAQQQYADRLKDQLNAAPPNQREHLQQTLNHELEVIAATVKERDGIAAQQKQLEKPAAGTNAPATPPPSQ
jgi:hypothetical protein